MNWIDIVLFLLFIWNIYFGWKKGLIKKIFDLLVWVIIIYFGINYASEIGNKYLSTLSGNQQIRSIIIFTIFFISIFLVEKIILKTLLKSINDSIINKLIGLLLGIIQAVLITSLLLSITQIISSISISQTIQNSKILSLLNSYNLLFHERV
ncbi:MAG: CvpA family protein [Bacteroidetes bacterium]|nr:CvpA family protein [Bacteroidota bacterium]